MLKEEKKMSARSAATQSAVEPAAKKIETEEEVFERLDRIYDQLARRAFEIFSTSGKGFGYDLENWFQAESELLHPVHLTLTDHNGAVNLSAEVPGFEVKDLEIKLEPHRVTISGSRESREQEKKGETVYHEHCANQILRVVDLPAEVDASKAEAKLKNGVLEMHIPKGKPSKTTHVQIKGS